MKEKRKRPAYHSQPTAEEPEGTKALAARRWKKRIWGRSWGENIGEAKCTRDAREVPL